jgi:hypothetical protein
MKVHLISFATPQYLRSQKQLNASAKRFGVDIIHNFTQKDLKKTAFYTENKAILSQEQGAGYWLWKPYFILKVLNQVAPNDIVLYADTGNTVLADLSSLFTLCRQNNIVLFQVHQHFNKAWTKRDTFVLMDSDTPQYHDAQQVCGSPLLFLANDISRDFIEKWLFYCQNEAVLTDIPNTCGEMNAPEFQAHRHDQSVLSLLALKAGIPIHRDPSQFGNPHIAAYPQSEYGQLLDLHRRKHFSFWLRVWNRCKNMYFRTLI